MRRIMITFLVLGFGMPISNAGAQGPVTTLEQGILTKRRSLQSGELKVDSTEWRPNNNADKAKTVYEIVFRGQSNSTMQTTGRVSLFSFEPFAKSHSILTEEGILRREFDMDGVRTNIVSQFVDPSDAASFGDALVGIFDPRLMGLAPVHFDVLHSITLESFVGNPGRSHSRSETSQNRDGPVEVVHFGTADSKGEIHVIPDKDFSVVRSSITVGGLAVRIENELAEFQCGSETIWFPSKITYTESEDGEVVLKNVAEVRSAVFNQPIDDDRLTFKGLGLTAGSLVADSRNIGEKKMWDGQRIVKAGRPTPPPLIRVSSKPFPWWTIALLLSASVAFFYGTIRRLVSQLRLSFS